MNKNEAIRILNNKLSPSRLSVRNTHWSNLVEYGQSGSSEFDFNSS